MRQVSLLEETHPHRGEGHEKKRQRMEFLQLQPEHEGEMSLTAQKQL